MGLCVRRRESDQGCLMNGTDPNEINSFRGFTPDSIVDYIDALDAKTFHSWRSELAWARDTRNDFLQPTRGTLQRVSLETTLPGSTVQFYKLNYEFSKYWPISRALVLNTRFDLGYGDSYGSDAVRVFCQTNPGMPPTAPAGMQMAAPPAASAPGTTPHQTLVATRPPSFKNINARPAR